MSYKEKAKAKDLGTGMAASAAKKSKSRVQRMNDAVNAMTGRRGRKAKQRSDEK